MAGSCCESKEVTDCHLPVQLLTVSWSSVEGVQVKARLECATRKQCLMRKASCQGLAESLALTRDVISALVVSAHLARRQHRTTTDPALGGVPLNMASMCV